MLGSIAAAMLLGAASRANPGRCRPRRLERAAAAQGRRARHADAARWSAGSRRMLRSGECDVPTARARAGSTSTIPYAVLVEPDGSAQPGRGRRDAAARPLESYVGRIVSDDGGRRAIFQPTRRRPRPAGTRATLNFNLR